MADAAAAAPRSHKPRPFILARLRPSRRREGEALAVKLRELLEQDGHHAALDVLLAALAGDATAARNLIAAVPSVLHGEAAVVLHLHDVPQPVMREVVEAVTFASQAALCLAAPGLGRLAAMFRHAGTEAPTDLPEMFTAWRGVRGMGVKRGAKGLDWTLDRDAAQAALEQGSADGGLPLLLTATARRQDVGLRVGNDLVLYAVTGARVDRERREAGWQRQATGAQQRTSSIMSRPSAPCWRRNRRPMRSLPCSTATQSCPMAGNGRPSRWRCWRRWWWDGCSD